MVLKFLKDQKDKRVMTEIVLESIEESSREISRLARGMSEKLRNGGGEAIIEAFHGSPKKGEL